MHHKASSKKRWNVWLVASLCLCMAIDAPLARAQSNSALPNLGDGAALSPAAERRLGDSIVRQLYRDPDYVEDVVVMDYVQSIWQPLLAAARARGDIAPNMDALFAWEVLLGRDRSVNAFALPGAYMGLHLGLIAAVQTRDELASVMGHELSHITQRHIARNMAAQSSAAPWMVGALILAMIAAGSSNANAPAANAMITGSQALAIQNQLNFSRDMEREADRVGFSVSTEAGFAPQGFVDMFYRLQQASRLNDSGNYPYLRSHPLTTERIADMQTRIGLGALTDRAAQSKQAADWEALFIGARARVLSSNDAVSLSDWATQAQNPRLKEKSPVQQATLLYGAAFASLQTRQYAQAQGFVTQLLARAAMPALAQRQALLLGTEIAIAQGDGAQALLLLDRLPPRLASTQTPDPSSRAALLWRCQALLLQSTASGGTSPTPAGAQAASALLRSWLADHPRDTLAWSQLAAVHAALGRNVAAVRAQAEVSWLQQDTTGALDRFKAAQDLVRTNSWGPAGPDHIEASIVDTRTREIAARVRQQALDREKN